MNVSRFAGRIPKASYNVLFRFLCCCPFLKYLKYLKYLKSVRGADTEIPNSEFIIPNYY